MLVTFGSSSSTGRQVERSEADSPAPPADSPVVSIAGASAAAEPPGIVTPFEPSRSARSQAVKATMMMTRYRGQTILRVGEGHVDPRAGPNEGGWTRAYLWHMAKSGPSRDTGIDSLTPSRRAFVLALGTRATHWRGVGPPSRIRFGGLHGSVVPLRASFLARFDTQPTGQFVRAVDHGQSPHSGALHARQATLGFGAKDGVIGV